MSMERVLFSIFAAICWISAFGVLKFQDPVKAALSLVACFFSLACLFLLQAAELMAVLEVLVYAGAIMVLFVFVIMLVDNKRERVVGPGVLRKIAITLNVVAVGLIGFTMIRVMASHSFAGGAALPEGFGSPKMVGKVFFESFLFHFELASVLLLVAIVGAVVISRRDEPGREEADS